MFVNPHGCVHDMLTVAALRAGAVSLHGRPTESDSWFPGYAWTIACCATCGAHAGWRFTAASAAAMQQPRVFWGLRRGGFVHDAAAAEEDGGSGDERGMGDD